MHGRASKQSVQRQADLSQSRNTMRYTTPEAELTCLAKQRSRSKHQTTGPRCETSSGAEPQFMQHQPQPPKLGKGSDGLSPPFKKTAASQPAMPHLRQQSYANNGTKSAYLSTLIGIASPPAVCRYFTNTQLHSDNGSSWLTTASHRCCPGPSRGKGWARLRVGRSVLRVPVLRSQTAMHTSAHDRYMWV